MSIRGQLGKSQAGSRYLTKSSLTTVMLVLCIYQCFTPPFSAVPDFVAVSLSAQSSPIAAIDRDLITHTVYEEEGKGRGKGGRKEKGNRKRKTSKNPSTQGQPSRGPQDPSPSQSKRGKEGGSSKPKRMPTTRGSKGKGDSESLNIDLERARGPAPSIFRISKAQFCHAIQLGHFFVEICESVGFANHNLIMNESRRLPALFFEVSTEFTNDFLL